MSPGLSGRYDEAREAAARVVAVGERENTAVGLGDLAREHQPDAAAARFGREEGHEQVVGVCDAGAVVLDLEDQAGVAAYGAQLDRRRIRRRRLDCVPDEIDQRLLDLVGVAAQREAVPRRELHASGWLHG